VAALQLEGSTLCIRNPDGTALLIDSPGPEWQWHEYDAGGWFAFRPASTSAEFQDAVDFGRIWGMPDCSRIADGGRPKGMPAAWEQRVVSCGASSLPEEGSLRLHTRLVMGGESEFQSVSYYTPHGYQFISPVDDGREREHVLKSLASYRIAIDRACGPVPERPGKRSTTTR
jgi:hypothetical protein